MVHECNADCSFVICDKRFAQLRAENERLKKNEAKLKTIVKRLLDHLMEMFPEGRTKRKAREMVDEIETIMEGA